MTAIFDEIQFPPAISKGSAFGPMDSVDVVVLWGRAESRNINWSIAPVVCDISTGVKTQADLNTLIAFFRARRGRARGFRLKDWTDYSATGQTPSPGTIYKKSSTDVTINAAAKTYTSAGAINFSTLAAGDKVYFTGCTTGLNNGTKTVVSATATVLTVAEVLANDAAGAPVVILRTGPYQLQKLYPDSINPYTRTIQKPVSGTVIVYFVGVLHPTWWTVDLTLGIVSLVGGVAAPSDGDALTADFQFDVPARFDTDRFSAQITDIGIVISGANSVLADWAKVPIVEIPIS